MADDDPLHLVEVDHDPFADAGTALQEVDYDPFQQSAPQPQQAAPQVPVITVHPRSADRPVSQSVEDRRGEPGSWAAALGLPRWSDVTDAIAHPLTPQVPSELPMPATAGQLPHAAGLDDIQVPPEQPGFLDRLSALRERLRAAAPSSPQDFVTRQLTNLASVPGQIDTMTQAAHHLMMEPPLPPPKGSYTLDDGFTYPGTSDPAAWQAFAADQQARAETGPATALGMIGGGVPVAERGAAGIAGGRLIQPAAPQILQRAELVTPEGYAIPGRDYLKRASEVAKEIQAGPTGAGPLDLSQPRGPTTQLPEQSPLPRYDPARGVSARLTAAMQNPDVVAGVDEAIRRGMGLGVGMEKWYHTYPMRQAWHDVLGPEEGEQAFREYMRNVSASSPKSDAVTNSRTGSYYYQMGGRDLPERLPYPYGSIAQNLHRQNYETIYGPGWDLMQNPKPPSFEQNLIENLQPVTADTHAFRLPGILSGDPRFLESSARELFDEGKAPSEFAQKFAELRKDERGRTVATYRPRKLLESGRISPEEMRDIAPFWAAQPNPNEYAALEQFYTDRARALGLRPAEAQSAAWAGGGKITGLETPPDQTFPEIFNQRALFTSKMRNEKPEDTLRYLIRRQKPLLGIGGAIAAPSIRDFLDEPAPRRYSAAYNPA